MMASQKKGKGQNGIPWDEGNWIGSLKILVFPEPIWFPDSNFIWQNSWRHVPYLRWVLEATACVLIKERQRKYGDRHTNMHMAKGRVWRDVDTTQKYQQLSPAAGILGVDPPQSLQGKYSQAGWQLDFRPLISRIIKGMFLLFGAILKRPCAIGCLRKEIHHEKSYLCSLTLENHEAR